LASGPAARAAIAFQRERQAARRAELEARKRADILPGTPPGPPADGPSPMTSEMNAAKPDDPASRRPEPGVPQKIFQSEAKARIEAALGGEIGLVERLVWFWSNHFCVSASKNGLVRALAGSYEREAI